MISPPTNTEAELLAEIVAPDQATLNAEAARSIASLRFSDRAHARMADLCDRGNRGELSAQDQAEIESYRRVGLLLDLLQAKARLSLERAHDGSN